MRTYIFTTAIAVMLSLSIALHYTNPVRVLTSPACTVAILMAGLAFGGKSRRRWFWAGLAAVALAVDVYYAMY